MNGGSQQTRVFGMRLGIDPKIVLGAILLLAVFLFWYSSRGGDDAPASNAARAQHVAPAVVAPKAHIAAVRRSTQSSDRGTLRLRPVDATRGDIDPTLRLDLLTRLQSSDSTPTGRNLFDLGAAPGQAASNLPPIKGPLIAPKPLPPTITPVVNPGPPPVNIPLKFYGFVKPTDNREAPRGFFMDGDNVLVATEGQVLEQKYRVISLTATSARLEDVQLKQGQTLPVEAEASIQ